MLFRLLAFIVFALSFAATPARAEQTQYSQARLLSAVTAVGDLKTVPIALDIKLAPGWKSYWRTAGEAGLPPVLDWSSSTNVKSATILWPAPKRFVAFDIDNFGYEGGVTFPIDVIPEHPRYEMDIKLKLDILVCNSLCVPETHNLELVIPAGEAAVAGDDGLRAKAMAQVPGTDDDNLFSLKNVWFDKSADGKTYIHAFAHSTVPMNGPEADMFIEHKGEFTTGKPSFNYNSETQELQVTAPVRSDQAFEKLQPGLRRGGLTLTFTDNGHAFERRWNLGGKKDSATLAGTLRAAEAHVDPYILILALIGGLILNLMPCVLPVLSIKILSVLSHGGKDHTIHRAEIFRNFMASAAGIVFSFWILALGLSWLKNAGQSIGWGIQFQSPLFLLLMMLVLVFFSINLWGSFEIPLPRLIAKHMPRHQTEPTLLGHFLSGAFATLLATPCTAPFLGTAVGFALARETFDILIVFTFMGIGLALPYIVLAFSPKVFKYMPKPGAWMVKLKKALALVTALTAVWLLNVLVSVTTEPTLDDGWTKFDESLIKTAVQDGRTVVVDVTADWCLTCKANKRLVFESQEVEDAIFVPNVLRLQADWTHHDETISAYLKKYGRYGIPFNIIYGPAVPDGIILSELPSKGEVMRALAEAAGE